MELAGSLLSGFAIAASVLLGSWALLVLLAARLPPGLLKDLTAFLPACVTLLRRLRKDPRVPRSVKIAVLFAILWILSPIDLIPEFLPVIGPLDDAWPGERRLLDRLLGAAQPPPNTDTPPAH
jgi:hypothetical protein